MIRLMILGHKGMLGSEVFRYFSQYYQKYTLYILNERWGDIEFNKKLLSTDADFIINCIGATPQKYSNQPEKYKELNIDLPIFLETLGKKVVHPSTDCEFSGNLGISKKYSKNSKRDAVDPYGKSKAYISEQIEKKFKNTKIIRTSIIGHELSENKVSLLDWALSAQGTIRGYTDHYWNGITTTQWCKICEKIIIDWNNTPVLNQYGTNEIINKYNLINTIFKIYTKNVNIEPYATGQAINKCLESDIQLPPIETQISELKESMKNKPKNLCIITSVINISSNPLNYTKKRSVFSAQERFDQTIKTIESLRKIPNSFILHIEGSTITAEWEREIREKTDLFLNIYDGGTDQLRKKIDGKYKNIAEGTMIYKGLQIIALPLYQNIFKISGRYWLNEKFDWDRWENNDSMFRTDAGILITCFYKINKKDFAVWLSTLNIAMNNKLMLEKTFKKEMTGYKILNEQGLSGYVSVDGTFINF